MPMKTNFTSKTFSFFATFIILAFSLSLNAQTTHNVSVTNYVFTPSQLTITVGDKVIWTNSQGSHNVNGTQTTFPSNPESFGNAVSSGWTYEYTFNTAGTYDYRCNPHAGMGMTGKIIVNPPASSGPFTLTVNFTSMTPHIGQTMWLAVIDQATKIEIGRVKKSITSAAFVIEVSGIEAGKSYFVDFYSDHNKNGVYNAPPTDHAWRMTVNNVTGNTTLDFVHNTTFTDIAWKNKLTVHFTNMTPHLTQTLTLYLKELSSGLYKDTITINSISAATFDINSWEIKPGLSYNIDFYADHNKNGVYNAPPTDHAWRIPLNTVKSDTIINFVHNTNFTDIFSITSSENLAQANRQITLYPNPASQSIELKIPRDHEFIRSLKVFSITGSMVDQKVLTGNVEDFRYDISSYKNGVYFMEINSVSRKDVLKFIKQ
jgi:plastocyanin